MAVQGGVAYRIRKGYYIGAYVNPLVTGIVVGGLAIVQYDDGSWDTMTFGEQTTTAGTALLLRALNVADHDGWIVNFVTYKRGAAPHNSIYVIGFVVTDQNFSRSTQIFASGYLEDFRLPSLGNFEPMEGWSTYAFQGTVLEDATAGTHISSLTIVPGATTDLELLAGEVKAGAGAANLVSIFVDDGTNELTDFGTGAAGGTAVSLASGQVWGFPSAIAPTAAVGWQITSPLRLSGTMRFKITLSTATTGLTHTFAVLFRVRGINLPTATLADTVGVPVLTTNTNQVF